ncbi:MAG TPA: hypothetical protein VFE10_14925 [Phenylobacterium sp.]|jgi:uncharacterized protein YecT (DUF1311 family)|nr:hypothetical protein [Phenylobacterium sp.]
MPQVDLSTLNGVELRQLLDASRRRGDAALSYKVLQEMAARRNAPGARRGILGRGPAEPHSADVDLGEAAQDADDLPPMPNWRPPAAEADPDPALDPDPDPEEVALPPIPEEAHAPRRGRRTAQAPPAAASRAPLEAPVPPEEAEPERTTPDISRPLNMWDGDPAPIDAAAPEEWAQEPPWRGGAVARPAGTNRPGLRLLVGFALGIAVGGALGFWVGQMPLDSPPTRAPGAARVQVAALAPAPAPPPPAPAAAAPIPEATPDAATPPPPINASEAAGDADSRTSEPAPTTAASPTPAPAPLPVEPLAVRPATAESAPAVAAGCARQPTPADRAICGDPQLRQLQGGLRRAYAQALKAHTDRALLRQRQLAWRDARDAVTDPDRLAQLYEQRIRKLNAATAAALRQR